MPTVRYQIRSEYGLADPELYRAADKDDPEAVLEGVAMAGLVGVLRQLGDLAEFAAEIFHDLHEEVMSTAARGHGLLLRVQQLEAEFPSIEKAFLVQTNHSQFAYNDGIDWHANLRMDQNLVTQGDMPRFVLDSYEECRGPPRLFMLDKFDVAGSGACSKRYSDPSFFKVEFSSGMMEEIQWENKPRKIRKKAPRWKNGETSMSFMAPLINSNLQTENSDQVSVKVPARRVKLKSRNLLDSDITDRTSYMEHLLEVHLSEQVWPENSFNHLPEIVKSIDSGLTPEAHEIVIDTIDDSPIVRATYLTESPARKEVSYFPTNELNNHKIKSVEMSESTPEKRIIVPDKTESFDGYVSDKPENWSRTLMEVGRQKPSTDGEFSTEADFGCRSDEAEKSRVVVLEVDPEKYLISFKSTPEDEYGEHRPDDIRSDQENYVDALNTMESEVETDPEHRAKSEKGLSNMGTCWIESGICEQQDLAAQPSEPDSVGELTASREWNSMLEHSLGSVNSGDLAGTKQHLEDKSGFCVPTNKDNFVKESPVEMLDELRGSDGVRESELSVHLLPNGTCNAKESDVTSIKSIIGEESFGSLVMDFVSTRVYIRPEESDEAQSVSSLYEDKTGYVEGTNVVPQQLDGKLGELPDVANNPNNISSKSISLSEMVDLSLESKDVLQGIDPTECAQEQISEEGTIDVFDHLSEANDRSDFEEIPTEHVGESMLNLTANLESVKEVEACLDGSVSPNIPESSPEIFNDNVQNSHEVVRDLDGALPHTNDIGFTEPIMKSRIFFDDLSPLSDTPGFSSMEDVEPLFSQDMEDIQGETVPEEVSSGHIEDPAVLNVEQGALEDSMEHDNKTYSCEHMSPSDPALSLEKDQLPIRVRNIVAGVEDISAECIEERKSPLPKIVPLELGHFSDAEELQESHRANSEEVSTMSSQKDTILDDMQLQLNISAEDAGKSNTLMPNTKSLVLKDSSTKEEPQDCRDGDSTDEMVNTKSLWGTSNAMFSADMQLQDEGSGLMVNSDSEEPMESRDATSMEHFSLGAANEILLNMYLLNECGHMVTSDENDSIDCPTAASAEHFPLDSNNGNFPDDLQLQNKEHGHLVMGTLGLPSGSAASDLHKESVLLEKHTECTEFDDSSDEYVIVESDDNNQSICSVFSGKSSGFDIHLQENYLPCDAVLDQHDMEVKESSDVNNLILPSQNESQPICTTAENGASGPKEGNSPSCHFFEDGSEPIVASSHQDSSHLESVYTQFQITCINDINLAQSISEDNAGQPSKPDPHAVVSNSEIDEPDVSLSKEGVHEKVEDEASVASRCSSEISVASSMSSISAAGLAPIASSTKDISESGLQEASLARSSQVISEIGLQKATIARSSQELSETSLQESETILQETAIASSSHTISENGWQETAKSRPDEPASSSQSQDVVEKLPLPPLPPMEWRLGKLQFGSITSNGFTIQPPTTTNPSTKLINEDEKCPQDPQSIVDEMVQPETSFASLPLVGNENFHHGALTLEQELTQPSRLSEFPPITDEGRQHGSLILETEVTNPLNSSLAVSHQEDGKYSSDCGASVPEHEDGTTQHPHLSQGESQDRRPQLGHLLHCVELERSQYEALSVARDPIPPPNPFFIGSFTEGRKHQCGYEVYGGENVQHLNFSAPVAARGPNILPYGFLYLMGQNPPYGFSYRSIRDRPRDPLIEAVAAHDKSTLRKVSELDHPSARPKADERDSLLEQIRNKAFNLKPANAPKPNIKGVPPTNLKVAAILEKANAIRQACAGSDEDEDDGDNWKDY